MAWALLAAWTPPPLHGWRRLLLRAFGAKIARGVRVYGSAEILYPPNLEMGEHSVLGPHTVCYCMDKVSIGDFVTVSQYTHLITGSHRFDEPQFQLYTKPIRVEAHAWLASAAFIGPGVTVGRGAVLGARAVTFRDLEPWTVYVGNPAAPLRARRPF